MKKEIILGKRILILECAGNKSCKIHDEFLDFLLKNEAVFNRILDEYKTPEEIIVNFTQGDGRLAGKYYIQKKNVREYVIAVDIYIDVVNENDLMEIVDTFIHEIIHNKIEDNKKTDKITKKIVKELFGKAL